MQPPSLRKVGQERLLVFDLENRPLAYWYDGETTSEITAFGWKWSDERRVHTMLLAARRARVRLDTGSSMDDRMAYVTLRTRSRKPGSCTATTSAVTTSPCSTPAFYGANCRR
jgi:hypothetical protein